MAQFDLSNIFQKAFGYNATDASKINIPKAPDRKEQSKLGQPFYLTDLLGREFFMPVTINDILIPFAVIGMTWKKTIVSTGMPERGGTVKELINIDDYSFNIKGILVNETNDFPDDGVMQIFDLFQINQSVTMRSVLSDIVLSGQSKTDNTPTPNVDSDPYGHRVAIKSINWPQYPGVEHARPFEMDVESDMIFDLEIA